MVCVLLNATNTIFCVSQYRLGNVTLTSIGETNWLIRRTKRDGREGGQGEPYIAYGYLRTTTNPCQLITGRRKRMRKSSHYPQTTGKTLNSKWCSRRSELGLL